MVAAVRTGGQRQRAGLQIVHIRGGKIAAAGIGIVRGDGIAVRVHIDLRNAVARIAGHIVSVRRIQRHGSARHRVGQHRLVHDTRGVDFHPIGALRLRRAVRIVVGSGVLCDLHRHHIFDQLSLVFDIVDHLVGDLRQAV